MPTAKELSDFREAFKQSRQRESMLATKARLLGVSPEYLARQLPPKFWKVWDRFCSDCHQHFTERRPATFTPKLKICAECTAESFQREGAE